MLDVHSIAAGGSSILAYRDGRSRWGRPRRVRTRGRPATGAAVRTLTDVQVMLGHLRVDILPRVFGLDGASPIDAQLAARKFAELTAQVSARVAGGCSAETVAESFLEVGVESMANAIRQVSTRQGLDAADFTLFCFGGAAGQHACRVARAAGVRRILVHPLASVLSAFGIGVADRLAVRRASLRVSLDEAGLAAARRALSQLQAQASAELTAAGEPPQRLRVTHLLELRAGDSEVSLSEADGPLSEVRERFHAEHRRRFGFASRALNVIIEALRAEARVTSIDAAALAMPVPANAPPATKGAGLVRRLAGGTARGARYRGRAVGRPGAHRGPAHHDRGGGRLARRRPRPGGAAAHG
jgi:5-oxoprolinase (ATP-hydrolysing)